MKKSDRRTLLNILEDRAPARAPVREDIGEPERALVNLVTGLAVKTAAYRKDLTALMDIADNLQGKLPGFEAALDQMIGALEMSDKMLEDLTDAALGDAKPYFKKLGLTPPRH